MHTRIWLLAVLGLGVLPGCSTTSTCASGGSAGPVDIGGGNVIGGTRSYAVTDLGTLGGPNSGAAALNDNLQVVGLADTSSGAHHAFLWQNAKMTDLGTLGGANSAANAVDSNGSIVGTSDIAGGRHHAFLYSGNGLADSGSSISLTDLGTLGGPNSAAFAIDTRLQQIVGAADIAGTGAAHAFLTTIALLGNTGGSVPPTDIGTLGGTNSRANALSGVNIVGASDTSLGAQHAFIYSTGTIVDLNSQITPTSGWVLETATGINTAGYVVGTGTINGAHHAFLLTPQ